MVSEEDRGPNWVRCVCGKRGYASRTAAKNCFRTYGTSAGKSGNRIRVYLCPESGTFHLTDMDKSRGRRSQGGGRQRRAKQKQKNRSSRRNWKRDHGQQQ